MGTEEDVSLIPAAHGIAPRRFLSALLSQVLVAFRVEFDNEFERRMGVAGYPGARLSLVVWANLMRFVGEVAISVRDLATQALAPDNQVNFELGVWSDGDSSYCSPIHPTADRFRLPPSDNPAATGELGGAAGAAFVQIGWFALLLRAVQRARFGRHCLPRSRGAGRSGLART